VQARTLVQQARVLARARGDQSGEAEALYRLATVSFSLGRPDDALQIALEASELAHVCGEKRIESFAGHLIGIVHFRAGNFKDALDQVLGALELYRTADVQGDEGSLLNTIAAIHHSLGDTERAIVTYEAAIHANKGFNHPEQDAIVLNNIASIRAERQEGLLAISLGEEALKLAREHAPARLPELLAEQAGHYVQLQSLDHARQCLEEADEIIAQRIRDGADMPPLAIADVRLASGRWYMARGDYAAAVSDFLAAKELFDDVGSPTPLQKVHRLLADAYKAQGDFERALEHSEARFVLHQELFDQGTDLRIKTLQIAHDTEHARQQAEILRLRTSELEAMVERRTYDL
jgi:tetratricopeptide (TPR) repeat protein